MIHTTVEIPVAKDRDPDLTERTKPLSKLLAKRFSTIAPRQFDANTPLLWWLDQRHPSQDLIGALDRWVAHAMIRSPRTGELLHLRPYRLRYTIALDAARNGASRAQLMTLLDHADTQNVDVYFDAAGIVMRDIEKSLDAAFAPSIKRFLGAVSDRGVDNEAVVPAAFPQMPDVEPIHVGLGRCTAKVDVEGICRLAPPIACYTCAKFVAFRDAPHREVADCLEAVARRERETTGGRVTSALLPAIHAAREVVRLIAEQSGDLP